MNRAITTPIPHEITKIDFSVTDACPMRCSFCYARKPPGSKCVGWDADRAWAALHFLLSCPPQPGLKPGRRRRLDMIMLGGEPLLHDDAILDWLGEARERHGKEADIWSTATTNLYVLRRAWLGRARAMNFRLHLSIDGLPEAHDVHRRLPDGSPSSPVVFRHARWVLDVFPNVTARATVTPENVRFLSASAVYLAKFGFQEISQEIASGSTWSRDDLGEHAEQTMQIARWWVECMGRGIRPKVTWLDVMLRKIWSPIRKWHACHAGVARVAVDTAGRFWPCHYFVGCTDPALSMGDLEGGLSEQGAAARRRFWMTCNLKPRGGAECDTCEAVNGCDHYCLHNNWSETGDLDGLTHWHCAVIRAQWRAAMYAHGRLIRAGSAWYLNLYDPRRQKGPPPQPQTSKQPIGQGSAPQIPKELPAARRARTALKIPDMPGAVAAPVAAPVHGQAIAPALLVPQQPMGKPESALVLTWRSKGAPRAVADGLRAAGWRVETLEREGANWQRALTQRLTAADAPQWLVCWQRLYKGVNDEALRGVAEAKRRGMRSVYMDFGLGLWDHWAVVVFDPDGENAVSSIAFGGPDRLAARPDVAAQIEARLPDVTAWGNALREEARRAADDQTHAELIADLRGGPPWALFVAQFSKPDMVLVADARSEDRNPQGTATRFVESCLGFGLRPIVKPHPFDAARYADTWEPLHSRFRDQGAIVLPARGDARLLAWLLSEALAVVLVNSTVVFDALALDRPILQLGRGWVSGNGIVREGAMGLLGKSQSLRGFDSGRRRRFLALMLSRQARIADLRRPETLLPLLRSLYPGEPPRETRHSPATVPTPAQEYKAPPNQEKAAGAVPARLRRLAVLGRSMSWPSGVMRRHVAITNWFHDAGFEIGFFLVNWPAPNRAGAPRVRPRCLSDLAAFDPEIVITGWPMCVQAVNVLGRPRAAARVFLLVTYTDVDFAAVQARRGWLVAPISRHLAEAYLRGGGPPDRMRPIVNGIDLDQFGGGRPMTERHGIVWRDRQHRDVAAGAGPPENIDDFPAFAELNKAWDGHTPVGTRPLLWEYRNAAFRVAWDQMQHVYRGVRLVLLNETKRAGGCNTILEAAACGCPVIARDVPATREMIRHGETGWLVRDMTEGAALARQLYDDCELLTTIAAAARREIENQGGWKRYCEQLADFIGLNDSHAMENKEEMEDDIMARLPEDARRELQTALDCGRYVLTVSYKPDAANPELRHFWNVTDFPTEDIVPAHEHIGHELQDRFGEKSIACRQGENGIPIEMCEVPTQWV